MKLLQYKSIFNNFKGIVHPKMKILSLITHPHVVENKNNDFIQQFVSSASPYSAIAESITYVNNVCNICTRICCLRSDQSLKNINNVFAYGAAKTEQRTQFPSSGYSPKWRYADVEETNC